MLCKMINTHNYYNIFTENDVRLLIVMSENCPMYNKSKSN